MGLLRTVLPVDRIKVGNRVRKDAGDLVSLADSIGTHGLLHPIVVAPTDDLLAGWRRLEAVKLLGWTDVPVSVANDVADLAAALAVEEQENSQRKDFTISEADAMRRAIEALEKPKAKERQREGAAAGGRSEGSAKLAEPSPRPRDVAAKATGKSAETLRKAAKVIDIANDSATPEPIRELAQSFVNKMDETGKVDGAHRETQAAIAAHIAEAKPEIVDHHLGLEAGKAIRKFKAMVKTIDPARAAAGSAGSLTHLDLHVESVDECLAWLTTYRRGLMPLAIVKEAK